MKLPRPRIPKDIPFKIDTPEDWFWMIFGISITLTISWTVYTTNPGIIGNIEKMTMNLMQKTPEANIENTIIFKQDQIDLMNKAYLEKRHEKAWCLVIEGNKVTNVMFTDNFNESESSITFSCPVSTNGISHTHPGVYGTSKQSFVDMVMFANSNLEVSCIQSGVIKEGLSSVYKCYKNPLINGTLEHDNLAYNLEYEELNVEVI